MRLSSRNNNNNNNSLRNILNNSHNTIIRENFRGASGNRLVKMGAKQLLKGLLHQTGWILLIVALISIPKFNCDHPPNTTPATAAATTTLSSITNNSNLTTTTTTTPSNSTTATETATGKNLESDDYRQRPNPAGSSDSSTKISYDMQHELKTTTLPTTQITTTAGSVSTGQMNETASTSASTDQQQQQQVAKIEKKALIDPGSSNEFGGSSSPDNVATGEALISDFQPMADMLSPASPSSLASALDYSTLDLDVSAATNPSVISRHGRASASTNSQQQQQQQQTGSSSDNSYTPPASSRLSPYTPMLLQNSRYHSPTSQTQAAAAQTTTTTTLPTAVTPARPNTPFDPIIVCYLGSWSVYRPSLAKFTPENINPFLCTHIIYAFAGLSSKYELKPFDTYNDITQGGYRKFTGLKDYNKQLKTLIAVGGWNEGSAR